MPLSKDHIFFGLRPTMTEEQLIYVNSMIDNKVTVVNAIAGAGKTLLSVGVAALLKMKLVYVFAPVEEDKMGFRPGTQTEKELSYITPLKDALTSLNFNPSQCIYNEDRIQEKGYAKDMLAAQKKGNLWVYPMSHIFARGINIDDSFIIIDEAENFTRDELKKIITRIHDNCRVVIAGHTGQCDLRDKSLSGFKDYIEFYKTRDYAQVCQLSKNFRGIISSDADTIDEFIHNRKVNNG